MSIEEYNELIDEVLTMLDFAKIETSGDAQELVERLSTINAFMARASEILADAKLALDNRTSAIFDDYGDAISRYPATIAGKYISSLCAKENRLIALTEMLYKSLVHQGDNLRTQISFEKENLRLTKCGY